MPIKSVKMKISKNKKMRFFLMSQGSLNPKIRFLGQKVCSVARTQTDKPLKTPKMTLKMSFFKISKNKKMRFFIMSQGPFSPKIRFLGQEVSSVARRQTDTKVKHKNGWNGWCSSTELFSIGKIKRNFSKSYLSVCFFF